jgi:hypothetical protein
LADGFQPIRTVKEHGKPIVNFQEKIPKHIIFLKYFLCNRPQKADSDKKCCRSPKKGSMRSGLYVHKGQSLQAKKPEFKSLWTVPLKRHFFKIVCMQKLHYQIPI